MALKDDLTLVATIGAIILTRHNHPLESKVEDALKTAVALLDATDKLAPPVPPQQPPA